MFKKRSRWTVVIDDKRIYIMFGLIFIIMAVIAPNFFNTFNMTNILKATALGAMVAAGFTVVLICGYLDLSIGSVINLGAVMVIVFANMAGLAVGVLAALVSGLIVGLINGFIVTKGKIHAFIVTLGMQTTIKGLLYIITGSASINLKSYGVIDFMESRVLLLFTPKVLITLLLLIAISFMLSNTKIGRALFLMGGNREAAWVAGHNVERLSLTSFVISAGAAVVGGILFALSSGTAVPNMGEKGLNPQLLVISATIIGGTSMSGGKGSVVKSAFAVLMLTTLFNGFGCLGVGYEFQIASSGLILAAIVTFESFSDYRSDLKRGQRSKLLMQISNVSAGDPQNNKGGK